MAMGSRSTGRYSANQIGRSRGILSDDSHLILQDSSLQHWFKNWQHLRKDKLTASTFGLAVGFWPRGRIKLWLEKHELCSYIVRASKIVVDNSNLLMREIHGKLQY